MDFFIPIVLFIIFFILFSICGYCCKRNKQGIVYGVPNPQQITATTTAYNTTNPPYPVMETPMPQPMTVPAPGPGFAHAAYPPAMPPYPPTSGGYQGNQPYPQMPIPAGGVYTSPVPPYPTQPMPQPVNAHQQQPPSYAEAVTQPVQTEVYAKQSPYNPNY